VVIAKFSWYTVRLVVAAVPVKSNSWLLKFGQLNLDFLLASGPGFPLSRHLRAVLTNSNEKNCPTPQKNIKNPSPQKSRAGRIDELIAG
jgi:hypothetical protein